MMFKRLDNLAYGFILTGVILRAINLAKLFHFTYDESVIAYIGRRIFVQGHISLIGGVTPFHVHLAPYFYWLSGIILRLGNFDPIVWGDFTIVLSFLVMLLIYRVGRKVFGQKVAFFATIFYAFSFLINIFDRHYWGIVFNPIISILVFWALVEIVKGRGKFFLLLAVSLAFGFHTDPSNWVLILVSLITIWYFKVSIDNWMWLGALIFFLSFLPLIVFDVRHQGVNIAGLNQYLGEINRTKTTKETKGKKIKSTLLFVPKVVARTIYPFTDTDLAKQYAYCPQYSHERLVQVPWGLTILALLFLIVPFFFLGNKDKGKAKVSLTIITIYFLCVIIGSIIYSLFFGGVLFDHYFSTAFVFIAFLAGINLFLLWQKNRVVAGFLLLFFLLTNTYFILNARHSFGYRFKKEAINWTINELKDNKFALESLGSCFKYNGYRYLFTLAGKEPEKSYTDQNFFWLYEGLPAEKHPRTTVVFVSPAGHEDDKFWQQYNHFLSGTIKSARFGGIEVLIVDNSSGEYNGDY